MPKNIASLICAITGNIGREPNGTDAFNPYAEGQNYLVPDSPATIRRKEHEANEREKYFKSSAYLRRKVTDI